MLSSALDSTGGTKKQLERVLSCEQEVQRSADLILGDLAFTMDSKLRSLRQDQEDQYKALERLLKLYDEPMKLVSEALVQVQASIVEEVQKALFGWLSTLNDRERHQYIHRDVLPWTGQWAF